MQYRRRLRSRIVISFALLGTGLTALFAGATIYLRDKLESDLIGETLQREVDSFVEFKRLNPDPNAPFSFAGYEALIVRAHRTASVPFDWRDLEDGVHDFEEIGPDGKWRYYKLAVQRDADLWAFLRYDASREEISKQQLVIALAVTVAVFSTLALLLGVWASSRVMSPVAELARRLRAYAGEGQPEPLAPQFADDEVGQLAAALDDYAARLTELVRRDREFNADVSHELRTPLAVIRGATELLLGQPDLTDKAHQRLKRIERAAQQSADLTSALLMLSRNERGSGPTDVRRVAEQIVEANRANLHNKPVQLTVEGGEGVLVDAPESVLAVAIGNLVGNACKYTAEGEVRVLVAADCVRVDDTGPGISAEDAERLFERGFRGQSAGSSKGAGIGLAIVQRLCDLYGWRVSIAPRQPRGASASLEFRPGARRPPPADSHTDERH